MATSNFEKRRVVIMVIMVIPHFGIDGLGCKVKSSSFIIFQGVLYLDSIYVHGNYDEKRESLNHTKILVYVIVISALWFKKLWLMQSFPAEITWYENITAPGMASNDAYGAAELHRNWLRWRRRLCASSTLLQSNVEHPCKSLCFMDIEWKLGNWMIFQFFKFWYILVPHPILGISGIRFCGRIWLWHPAGEAQLKHWTCLGLSGSMGAQSNWFPHGRHLLGQSYMDTLTL